MKCLRIFHIHCYGNSTYIINHDTKIKLPLIGTYNLPKLYVFIYVVQIKNPHCNINNCSSQKCLVYNQRKVHLGVFCFLVMFLLIYRNFLLEYSLYSNLNETFTQRIKQHYEYQTHIFKFKTTRKQFFFNTYTFSFYYNCKCMLTVLYQYRQFVSQFVFAERKD